MKPLAPVLMVQGTASSVGKSTFVAGLCRMFARRGLRIAPFKAQNMSNNAAVCRGGGEIGRAQYAQAIAAGVAATVDMNPILLKPQGDACQVVVRGQIGGVQTAADYFGSRRIRLWPVVAESLDRLRSEFDLVIAEGAGSPAEINLRDRDLVNMAVALHAQADVVLVGDIDRGGVFASLLGTWEWLNPEERALVRGFVLNKFRGDPALLAPAPSLLEQRTSVPVLGVIPYVQDLVLPEEDSATVASRETPAACVEIAVVRLPHLANFDEFAPLNAEPNVSLRYVSRPEEMRAPDLVIVPGTKATIPDLLWLQERGLAQRIRWLAEHATPVLGICGGYQMLGTLISDPLRTESEHASAPGLRLLSVESELSNSKRLVQTRGHISHRASGIWSHVGGAQVEGYEIHTGRTAGSEGLSLLDLETGPDGVVSADGTVAGTYVHGIFECPELRQALLSALAGVRGYAWQPNPITARDSYDAFADLLATSVRFDDHHFPGLATILAVDHVTAANATLK